MAIVAVVRHHWAWMWSGFQRSATSANHNPLGYTNRFFMSVRTFRLLKSIANAHRDAAGRVKNFNAAFADLGRAVVERPADVKAAIAKLYPDTDAATLDLLYAAEASAWNAPPVSLKGIQRDIAFMKSDGTQVPDVDPAGMVLTP